MTINYNVTGAERKRLADYISGFMGTEKKYLGAPTFAYQVGYITISKDGAVSFEDRGYNSDIDALMDELERQGFHTEEAITKADSVEPVAAPAAGEAEAEKSPAEAKRGAQGANVGLTVALPLDKVQVDNLNRILDAKGRLIKKALGIDATPVEVGEDAVSFPWFSEQPEPDAAKAYTHLISALCEMSVNQKRITAREKATDNDKYAFRCFLLRLGFIGAKFKDERKILLATFLATARSNLEGRRPLMRFPNREVVERLRREYPVGCRVELLRMDDSHAPPIGTMGTAKGVDDSGSIMVAWGNGSGLHVVYGEDECRKVGE